jgi:hypothetical protein
VTKQRWIWTGEGSCGNSTDEVLETNDVESLSCDGFVGWLTLNFTILVGFGQGFKCYIRGGALKVFIITTLDLFASSSNHCMA